MLLVTKPKQERAIATRARLLDGAIEALSACGYAGASTMEVCRRTGASRGTLLHHFPTKQALFVEAMTHVLDRRVDEFRVAFVGIPPKERTPARALDLMWALYTGPTFYAWVELLVASRTDEGLRRALKKVIARFGERSAELFGELSGELFPDSGALPSADKSLMVVFPLMNGLALDRIHSGDDQALEVLGYLKMLAGTLGAPV